MADPAVGGEMDWDSCWPPMPNLIFLPFLAPKFHFQMSLSFAFKHQKELQDEMAFTTWRSTYAPEASSFWQALGLEQSPP